MAVMAAALSAAGALAVAALVMRQVSLMRRQGHDAHEWNRRLATVELASGLIQGADYCSIRDELFALGFNIKDLGRKSDAVLADLSEADAQRADALINRLFNLFESFLVALRHGVVDETIAKDCLMLFVVAYYQKYEPWLIEQNRLEGRKSAFGEFLTYAKTWAGEYAGEVCEQEGILIYRSGRDPKGLIGG